MIGLHGELPDLWDLTMSRLGQRLPAPRASPRKPLRSRSSRGIKAADHEAGGRRRPLHLARRDGAAWSSRACSI